MIIVTFLLVRLGHMHVQYVILLLGPIAIWWHRPRAEKKTDGTDQKGSVS
jgi:hypothetical protein